MQDRYTDFINQLEKAQNEQELTAAYNEYLGKNGYFTRELKELATLPVDERRRRGPGLQDQLRRAKEGYAAKQQQFVDKNQTQQLASQAETLGFRSLKLGHLHPLTETMAKLNQFFVSRGFSQYDGPEVENDEYCFVRLNVPEDHPARDMQDTIYLEQPNWLLRTQTSSIEARALEELKAPFRVVSPGRVYRNEKPNKSNHFIFHHYQGVVLDEKANLSSLFGLFTELFHFMYGKDAVIRFRNKYYPEVEPGVGPDMRCFSCQGKGCAVCKGVGWIEMGGAGMIHANVLRKAGKDPKKIQGFAFGLGLDRWAMARHNITDIRTLLGGDLLYQPFEHESFI